MTVNPFAADVAAEHRRDLLRSGDAHRRAQPARRPARAGWATVLIRPVRPDDAKLVADIFAGLSPASRLARFLNTRAELTAAELRYLTDVDHRDHEALIAVTRLRAEPVGVVRFIRDASDPTSAEVAIEVVDGWQDRGVGTMLAARLTARALHENVVQFTALTAAGNLRARRLLGKHGDVQLVARDGATVSYRVTRLTPPMPEQQQSSSAPARCS